MSLPGGSVVVSTSTLYLQVDMKANDANGVAAPPARPRWSVGELAARFDLPTHVLRHWESLGLLSPERDASGYRRYGRADLVRVAVILRSKSAGMTLEQIGVLVDSGAEDRHDVLEAHLRDLAERAEAIERSRLMTEHALRCEAHDVTACPRFASYVADLTNGRAGDPDGWL